MDKSAQISQLSLKYGFILAAVSVVISLTMHFINPVLVYTNVMASIGIFVVFIALLVVSGITIRKEVGGFWTFGEAFKAFLIISLILAITATLYNFILMKFIDPDLPAKAAAAIEDAQRAMMAKFGLGMMKLMRRWLKQAICRRNWSQVSKILSLVLVFPLLLMV